MSVKKKAIERRISSIESKKAESTTTHKLVLVVLAVFALILIIFFIGKIFGFEILEFLRNLPFGESPTPTPVRLPLSSVFPTTFSFQTEAGGREEYTLMEDFRLYFLTQTYRIGDRDSYYFLSQINIINGECKEIWRSSETKRIETSGYTCMNPVMIFFSEEFNKEKEELGTIPEKINSEKLTRAGSVEYTLNAELQDMRYYQIKYTPVRTTSTPKYYIGEIYDKAILGYLWETDNNWKILERESPIPKDNWWSSNLNQNYRSFKTAFINAQYKMQENE